MSSCDLTPHMVVSDQESHDDDDDNDSLLIINYQEIIFQGMWYRW